MDIRPLLQAQFESALDVLINVVSDLEPVQLRRDLPGSGLVSIGSIAAHAAYNHDYFMNVLLVGGEFGAMTAVSGGYVDRLGAPMPTSGSIDEDWKRSVRLDPGPFGEYLAALREATPHLIASASDQQLSRLVPGPLGDMPVWRFLGVVGVQHLAQHTGEIAALKGTMGSRGLPF